MRLCSYAPGPPPTPLSPIAPYHHPTPSAISLRYQATPHYLLSPPLFTDSLRYQSTQCYWPRLLPAYAGGVIWGGNCPR
eukprot:906311-Rhodomonas_salina.1